MEKSEELRLVEMQAEMVDAEDRAASVLALMMKITDPEQRRYWSECADTLRERARTQRERLRNRVS